MLTRTLSFSLALALAAAAPAFAQEPQQQAPPQQQQGQAAAPLPAEQLDSLVAPIALYPDPLLAQVLAASTYPLEIVQLQQWLAQHKDLEEQALTDAVEKQDWDPSVQSLAAFPDAVKLLANDVKWTTDLGNAFLAQQSDVMEAVQRMRKKAKDKGALKSDDKMKVETKTVEKEQVIVIEQANPQVVYVPAYNPTVVYGPPPAAYAYPAYPPGYVAAGAIMSFGVGIAVGAAFHGGGWGYNCGWGGAHGNVVNINNNNNFVRNSNARGTSVNRGGQWQHDSRHRGGAPYRDQATANRFGGSTSRDTARAKQAPGGGDRGGGRDARTADRGGGRDARTADRGGGDRVGDRDVQRSADRGSSRGGDALGGGGHGSYSGSSARSSSARGSSSQGQRGGGGGRSGGGGRGGGRR